LKINLRRGHIIERLVRPLMPATSSAEPVVKVKVMINAPSSLGNALVIFEINLFILERMP
jgi:hypothetical protein